MSTVDRVQELVMSDLLRGALTPGSWVRQDELADRLGVSKIPVREALQRLAAIGLVRFEENRGVVVAELSAAEADEHFSLRRAIEPLLLERALPHLDVVDLAEAELALTGPIARIAPTEANWHFHRALYRSSGWQRGLALAETLNAAVAPYVALYTQGLGAAADSDAEHVELLDACRAGDGARALDVLDRHLTGAAASIVGFLRSQEVVR